jgi:hypothetical protein
MTLDGGPLTYASDRAPEPLTLDEQAALAFAACGITGHALAELPYADGSEPETGGGTIMMHLAARTAASGDASHVDTVFVIDDDGTWLLRRPQDYPPQRISELVTLAHERKLTELYTQSRVHVAEGRVDIPHDVSYMLSLNKWSANRPGTTYFLPIAELTAFCINLVLILFDEDFSYFVLDDRNWFQPAGIGRFARSRGGTLADDPKLGRIMTVTILETLLLEFAAVEQGGIMQNLGLMTQALGLGGFAHFAAHPWIWERELGFEMIDLPSSRILGMNLLLRIATRILGREVQIPTAVGLERGGEVLIRPYCPRITRRCATPCSPLSNRSTDAKGSFGHPTRRVPGATRPRFAPGSRDARMRRSKQRSRTAPMCTNATGGSRPPAARFGQPWPIRPPASTQGSTGASTSRAFSRRRSVNQQRRTDRPSRNRRV